VDEAHFLQDYAMAEKTDTVQATREWVAKKLNKDLVTQEKRTTARKMSLTANAKRVAEQIVKSANRMRGFFANGQEQ
jgi:hypothetical protein